MYLVLLALLLELVQRLAPRLAGTWRTLQYLASNLITIRSNALRISTSHLRETLRNHHVDTRLSSTVRLGTPR